MKIAINGCCHGELNKIYDTIKYIQDKEKITIDLLICCGDFQSFRNVSDMRTMAAPEKYQEMKDFHEYYNGKKKAPVLTLFIGGNHESANYLWELPYGGWVAENIFYLGVAGVVNFGGLRIGGLSGIYKDRDYHKGHFEKPPFNEDTKRSFYHVRSCDVAKLKLLSQNEIDIFLSHDWPRGIYNHGNYRQLVKFKPFLKDEIEKNILGSLPSQELLDIVKPKYWFAGHMHAKFVAIVDHANETETKFLALSKCLPRKDFLQIVDIESSDEEKVLKHDPEWICILQKCNNIHSLSSKKTFLIELDESHKPNNKDISNFVSTHNDLKVFEFSDSLNGINEQTSKFCEKFDLFNPCIALNNAMISNNSYGSSQKTFKKKMNLPKPQVGTPSVNTKVNASPQQPSSSFMRNDFDELVNPNVNPDEIDISESESDSSSDNESENEKKSVTSINYQYNSNMSTIESPMSVDISKTAIVKSTESKLSGDVTSEAIPTKMSTPQAKKLKLVRRNQDIYSTPSNDETDM